MSNSEIISLLSEAFAANIIGVLESKSFYHKTSTFKGRKTVPNETLEGLNEAMWGFLFIMLKIVCLNLSYLMRLGMSDGLTVGQIKKNINSILITLTNIKGTLTP